MSFFTRILLYLAMKLCPSLSVVPMGNKYASLLYLHSLSAMTSFPPIGQPFVFGWSLNECINVLVFLAVGKIKHGSL